MNESVAEGRGEREREERRGMEKWMKGEGEGGVLFTFPSSDNINKLILGKFILIVVIDFYIRLIDIVDKRLVI